MYKSIPTYDLESKNWLNTDFETKEDFLKFVTSHFKHPGDYNLQYSEGYWNAEGDKFDKDKYYCNLITGSRDFIKYWDFEKIKCDIDGGVIYKNDGLEYFVPGPYYFYLNYCRIYDKVENKEKFPDIWDSDLHFFIYVALCRLEGKHSIVTKSRQKGFSFKHAAILILNTWFSQRQTNKIFAYKIDYVEATWNFISQYRNHLNRNTGWYRNFSPDKTMDWTQRVEVVESNKKIYKGRFNILKGFTTKDDAAKIVGGGNNIVFGEESGVCKNLGKTHEYLLPAVKMGHLTTGLIMYSGSVGELEDCEPLKDMFYKPEVNGFKGVENIWDEELKGTYCGFFVPEYWNYPGYTDENGNSDIAGAKQRCIDERKNEEKKSPEQYRLHCSQHPFSPGEAFAIRSESRMPLHLITTEMQRIKIDNKYGSVVDLYYDEKERIKHTVITNSKQIMDFPVKADSNKEGAIVIYDFPEDNAPWGLYFAGVDPVRDIKTEYSISLAACYIIKRSVEKAGFIEPEKVVACYVGRYDDSELTHENMSKLIEFYNAQALVENDVDTFIRYMMNKKKQKHLISKQQLALLHEMNLNVKVHAIYGMTGTAAVANRLLQTVIDYLKMEIDKIYDDKGNTVKVVRGVNYTRDIMLLKEMFDWKPGLNVDRIKAFGYGLMAAQSHSTHYNYKQKEKAEDEYQYVKENQEINKHLLRTPFSRISKAPFNNFR